MKKNYLMFLFFVSIILNFYGENYLDEGSFIPSYYVQTSGYMIKNDGLHKIVDYSTISLAYNFRNYNFGYFVQDGTMPYFVLQKNLIGNILELKCCRFEIGYENDIVRFVQQNQNDLETVRITIIDNEEIIFDDFSYPKGTRFYRISGPAKIPISNAVLNDSNVRLRVKPNLNCDTWTKLNKGLQVKIKDKTSEKYEIDGESWYWYKVDHPDYPDGWVYGKYLDIENGNEGGADKPAAAGG